MIEQPLVNPGKEEIIEVDGEKYRRLCIRTHVITDADKLTDVVMKYAAPFLEGSDVLFITEKAVACTQKRAIPMKDIHPRPLAKLLSRFVLKTPYGIGLGIPETPKFLFFSLRSSFPTNPEPGKSPLRSASPWAMYVH